MSRLNPGEFRKLCELLPADVNWGDPLTPEVVKHVASVTLVKARVPLGQCDLFWDSSSITFKEYPYPKGEDNVER